MSKALEDAVFGNDLGPHSVAEYERKRSQVYDAAFRNNRVDAAVAHAEEMIKIATDAMYTVTSSSPPMTRERLFALHTELCSKGLEIMRAKNQDYTAGGGPFDNFRHAEALGVPGELGLLVRVMDKLMRMQSFIRNGTLAVKTESVEDAIIDVINYMVLFAGMIEEQRTS